MANLWIIASFYLFGRLSQRNRGELICESPASWLVGITLFLFLGLLLDESVILILAVVPVLFFNHFVAFANPVTGRSSGRSGLGSHGDFESRAKRSVRAFLLIVYPVAVFVWFMVFAAPLIISRLGLEPFRPFHYLGMSHQSHLADVIFSPKHYLLNLGTLLSPNLLLITQPAFIPSSNDFPYEHFPFGQFSWVSWTLGVFCVAYLVVAGVDVFRKQKALLFKIAAALAIVFFFTSAYISRHQSSCTGFYYGNFFSIFYALLIGLLLHPTG